MVDDIKEEILQKSLKLFLKHGIREMSNQKLVEILGVSTKTIYKYFTNKEGLLEEVLYLHHGNQYAMLERLPMEQNAACLFFTVWQIAVEIEYKINIEFYSDLNYYYPDLTNKVNAVIGKKFEDYFLSIIYKGLEEGTFHKNFLPEVALRSLFLMLRSTVRTDEFKKYHLSATELMLNTIANYIRGLCTEKGIIALDEHIQTLKSSKEAIMAK